MATATFNLSEEILPDVKHIVTEFGFKNEEEFFQEAIKDKILELRKKLFFRGTNRIAENLSRSKITEKEILHEFDKQKHQ